MTFLHLFDRSFRTADVSPIYEVTKSSFDWSTLPPFHPVESLQPLPTSVTKKLKRIQHVIEKPHHYDVSLEQARCKTIRAAAEKAWKSYKVQERLSHGQTPMRSAGWQDPFAPATMALIESLDTLWIMGLKREFSEGVHLVGQLDWNATTRKSCEVRATTAKMLGGLLAAYDLSKEAVLLEKAKELGDMLYMAFDTPNHMPPFSLDFEKARSGKLEADDNQISSSMTGILLELTRLAQITGEAKFFAAASRVVDELETWQNSTKLPGMWPSLFDLKEGTLNHDNVFGLGPDSRGSYEHLLKMYALLGGVDDRYQEMYVNASIPIISKLLFRPMTPRKLDVIFPGTFRIGDKEMLDAEIQHSACYAGGMIALGGRLFEDMEHMKLGARLTNGCMWAYNAFAHDIMPEAFKMVPCPIEGCKWDEMRWRKEIEHNYGDRRNLPMGFVSARDPSYSLRPEAIESVFVLYRITGHEEYRDAAWKMFQAIQNATDTPEGSAVVTDVTKTGVLQKRDSIEVSTP